MRPFFSSDGGVGATVEAARGRPAATPCFASVRLEEDDGWLAVMVGWVERSDGPKAKENYFRIKFGFLNIQRLWKFAQGDLGQILI
jgi:hypothetical protein